MLEMGRILTAAGLTAASAGLIIFGMGASHFSPSDSTMNIGLILMIAGVIASVVGIVLYRQTTVD